MKPSIHSAILTISILTITCSTAFSQNKMHAVPAVDPNVLMSAAAAQADIFYYDTLCTRYLTFPPNPHLSISPDQIPIEAFTVRAEDLLAAMGLPATITPTYDNIRVYLGVSTETGKFKLFIVPVKGADIRLGIPGHDILLHPDGTPVDPPQPLPLTDQRVLDLNAPCPNLCDNSSPLLTSTTAK